MSFLDNFFNMFKGKNRKRNNTKGNNRVANMNEVFRKNSDSSENKEEK